MLLITSTNLFHSDQHRCVPYALIKFMKFNELSQGITQKIKTTIFQQFLNFPLCKVVNKDLDLVITNYVGNNNFLLGKEKIKFDVKDYYKNIAEHVEEWTYIKFPYLKSVGWKGLKDGKDSGIYRVGPLGRLNAADGMATPLAQEEYRRMFKILGGKPVHATLAFHWARLIELIYAAERALELITDEEITNKDIKNKQGKPGEGIGIVEAARGTLIHHYLLDEKGLAKKINLIVATTHNAPSICLSIKNAAKSRAPRLRFSS